MSEDNIVTTLRNAANSGMVMTGHGCASFISPLSLDVAADLIESLNTQLAESRAREQAEVCDLIALAHKYGDCEFCKWRDDKGRCTEPNPGYLCAEHYKMEYRGPQDAKGEAR